ncbi:unnamed protein product [Phytomonas sp. EM1]|nr:unnamed protein product [Phytomonas sp. EM1]|eukprot:CCW65640.1 unnamed protein product [Phytomonas sp. isolate EM1]
MEEKFLKARQERMENNANRSRDTSELAQLRQQFNDEFTKKEREVDYRINQGSLEDAQQILNQMRALVQDASNSISLTAYDMSKANAILSRLQQALDGRRGLASECRKFRFSQISKSSKVEAENKNDASQSKSKPPDTVKTVVSCDTTATMTVNTNQTVYGHAKDTTLFVPHGKAAFIKDCVGCTILALPIAGSVFVSDCSNCTLYVACHQLRLKDCHEVDVYVCCASIPIIERCDGMRFGPYYCWSGLLRSAMDDGRTYDSHIEWVHEVGEIQNSERMESSFKGVNDFQWLKRLPSPHWRVLDVKEMKEVATVFQAPVSQTC